MSTMALQWVYRDSELGAHTRGPQDLLWTSTHNLFNAYLSIASLGAFQRVPAASVVCGRLGQVWSNLRIWRVRRAKVGFAAGFSGLNGL